MKQIILMRHAETEAANMTEKEVLNFVDPDLTERGLRQAQEIRDYLVKKKYGYDAVFTSLYQRTRKIGDLFDAKGVPHFRTNAFNEYYTLDGKGIESTTDGTARALGRIYEIFAQYESVIIVGHSSINQTILQGLLNNDYSEAIAHFHVFGETHVLRYDWHQGDSNWRIVDSFTPKQ